MTTVNSSSITHVCPKCETEKPLTLEFFAKKKRKTGYFWSLSACLECRRSQDRIRISNGYNKEARLDSVKKWKKNNPDKLRQQRYRAAKAKAEKEGRIYSPVDKNELFVKNFVNLGGFNARKNLKEFLASSSDEEMICWYTALGKPWMNPRLTYRERREVRYANDESRFAKDKFLHINSRIRLQIRKYINKYHKNKNSTCLTKDLIGVDIEQLSIHIEKQFTDGMTWNRFFDGDIHLDHIIPVSSFDFTNELEIKSCWSLPNLRPMWAKDNLSKGAKILTLL